MCGNAAEGEEMKHSEAVVCFDARIKMHLLNYLESRTDDNPALFVSLTKPHKCLMIGGVEARLRQIGEQAALPRVPPPINSGVPLQPERLTRGCPLNRCNDCWDTLKSIQPCHYQGESHITRKKQYSSLSIAE
jgi:hypothetical protein